MFTNNRNKSQWQLDRPLSLKVYATVLDACVDLSRVEEIRESKEAAKDEEVGTLRGQNPNPHARKSEFSPRDSAVSAFFPANIGGHRVSYFPADLTNCNAFLSFSRGRNLRSLRCFGVLLASATLASCVDRAHIIGVRLEGDDRFVFPPFCRIEIEKTARPLTSARSVSAGTLPRP